MPTCPSCGHTWTAPKRTRSTPEAPATADTAVMTTEQLYAFYKRTSHIGDVAFFAEHCGDAAIRNQAIVLLGEAEQGLPKPETLRRLTRLQESWRLVRLGWLPANEDRFWRAVRRLGARERGKRYRQARDRFLSHLRDACSGARSTYYQPTPNWSLSETIDGMIAQLGDEARELVRAARAICPAIDPELDRTAA